MPAVPQFAGPDPSSPFAEVQTRLFTHSDHADAGFKTILYIRVVSETWCSEGYMIKHTEYININKMDTLTVYMCATTARALFSIPFPNSTVSLCQYCMTHHQGGVFASSGSCQLAVTVSRRTHFCFFQTIYMNILYIYIYSIYISIYW